MSTAGLAPVMALAQASGLLSLADRHLSVPTDKGSNADRKIASLVGGMVGGVDSIGRTWRSCGTGRWGPSSTGPMHRRR
nr:hypothetical protein GCM10017611_02930 [Rhodococcus wratislaviensis]